MTAIRLFMVEIVAALHPLFSDTSARMTMIVGIFVYALIYPQPYVGEVLRNVPIAAIDQDNTTESRRFLREINATDQVTIAASVPDMAAARDAFFRRDVYGIVIVPAGSERDLLTGSQAPAAVYADGSYLLIYSNVIGAVSSVARAEGTKVNLSRLTDTGMDKDLARAALSPVAVTNISVFNPQGGYASYVVPASFVLILQQTLLMGIGLLHAGRRLPTGLAMWAAPLVYIGLYLGWIALTQILLPIFYGIPRIGDLGTLFLIALPFVCACTAMGFALALIIASRERVVFFLVVMGIPLFFLSGIAWPIETIAEPVRSLSLLVPSSSAIAAFVAVNQMGATPQDIAGAVQLQIILTFGYSLLAILVNRFGKPRRDIFGT